MFLNDKFHSSFSWPGRVCPEAPASPRSDACDCTPRVCRRGSNRPRANGFCSRLFHFVPCTLGLSFAASLPLARRQPPRSTSTSHGLFICLLHHRDRTSRSPARDRWFPPRDRRRTGTLWMLRLRSLECNRCRQPILRSRNFRHGAHQVKRFSLSGSSARPTSTSPRVRIRSNISLSSGRWPMMAGFRSLGCTSRSLRAILISPHKTHAQPPA